MPPIELDAEALGLSEEQINAINAAHDSGIEGLKNKNTELLGKLQKHKSGDDDANAELDSLRKFKQQADQNAEAAKGNYDEALKLVNDNHQKEIQKLQDSNGNLTKQLETILIDNGLSAALDGVKVQTKLKKAATAMHRGEVTLKDGAAMVGEVPLTDFINNWSQTDEGKAFIQAADNSGGDAGGGGNSGQGSQTIDYTNASPKEIAANIKARKAT